MVQREWRGAVGTAGLGYWTHDPDGSLPLAQLERPIPWASPRRATSIHTYIHTYMGSNLNICVVWERCLWIFEKNLTLDGLSLANNQLGYKRTDTVLVYWNIDSPIKVSPPKRAMKKPIILTRRSYKITTDIYELARSFHENFFTVDGNKKYQTTDLWFPSVVLCFWPCQW